MRQKNRTRFARILTLVCFFHFSGLNNGFTAIAISSGSVERVSFAPVFINSVATAFNPAAWRRVFSEGLVFSWFLKSGQIIEHASQKAVRDMFVESSLFDMLLSQSLNKKMSAPVPEKAGLHRGGSLADKAENALSERFFTQDAGSFGLEDGRSLLNTGRREAWIDLERLHLSTGFKYKFGFSPGLAMEGKFRNKDDPYSPGLSSRDKHMLNFVMERPSLLLLFSRSNAGDDPFTSETEAMEIGQL